MYHAWKLSVAIKNFNFLFLVEASLSNLATALQLSSFEKMEKLKLKGFIPEGLARTLWNMCEIQSLVLSSLAFQILLTIFGSRRRYYSGILVSAIVWFSYLMSSWVTIVALGKLTDINNVSVYKNSTIRNGTSNAVRGFWAPLLLVHYGGPDTITALSVEDTMLGMRQWFELAKQIGVVIFVLYKSWTNSWLSILTLPLFLVGIIKTGERVWALMASVSEKTVVAKLTDVTKAIPKEPNSFKFGLELLVKAYYSFDRLKPHLENWLGHPASYKLSSLSVYSYRVEDAFKFVEYELGFMYDVLYTKAFINYSRISFCRRIVCFLCLASSLSGFSVLFRNSDVPSVDVTFLTLRKYDKNLEISITYVLLVGAIVLEIYAARLLLKSDWAVIYLMHRERNPIIIKGLLKFIAPLDVRDKVRWSYSIGNLNLQKYCAYEEPTKLGRAISSLRKVRWYYEDFKKYRLTKRISIDKDLKRLIREQMTAVSRQRGWKPFSNSGTWALERNGCLEEFKWSIETDFGTQAYKQTMFGRAIILWHIATDVCGSNPQADEYKRNMSKVLSDYMMCLLATKPHMLSVANGDILFLGAVEQVTAFLKKDKNRTISSILKVEEKELYGFQSSNVVTLQWKVLVDVKKLAEQLEDKKEKKWIIISSVWVEMLCYAASNCPWIIHAQQLAKGGEFLTHVWLLLDHETDKFNIGPN